MARFTEDELDRILRRQAREKESPRDAFGLIKDSKGNSSGGRVSGSVEPKKTSPVKRPTSPVNRRVKKVTTEVNVVRRGRYPTESTEQRCLIVWRDYWAEKYSYLGLLHSIPNGGFRSKRTAMNMKLEGVLKGMPDLFLPVARQGFHGLYIELKRQKGGVLGPDQEIMIDKLRGQGYKVEVCKGLREAQRTILKYADLPMTLMDVPEFNI